MEDIVGIRQISLEKRRYNYAHLWWSDKGITVAWIDNIFHSIYHIKVPRTTVFPSLHGGSLKMALTVPLNWRMPLNEFLFKTKC